jgi:methylenetetrahydrofolate reductase (NADPH)
LYAQSTGHVANLHLTCTNLSSTTTQNPKEYLLEQLNAAKAGGIRNIVALRGDPPEGETEWKAAEGSDFTCALDLVTFIRANFDTYFGIAVAGYPEGHPNAITKIDDPSTLTPTEQARASVFDNVTYVCKDDDYEKEMDYLKKKVDAGAGTGVVHNNQKETVCCCCCGKLSSSHHSIVSLFLFVCL